MVDIHIHVEKKHLYLFGGMFLLLVGMGIVYSFGGDNPAYMGHSSGEIRFDANTVNVSAIDFENPDDVVPVSVVDIPSGSISVDSLSGTIPANMVEGGRECEWIIGNNTGAGFLRQHGILSCPSDKPVVISGGCSNLEGGFDGRIKSSSPYRPRTKEKPDRVSGWSCYMPDVIDDVVYMFAYCCSE